MRLGFITWELVGVAALVMFRGEGGGGEVGDEVFVEASCLNAGGGGCRGVKDGQESMADAEGRADVLHRG